MNAIPWLEIEHTYFDNEYKHNNLNTTAHPIDSYKLEKILVQPLVSLNTIYSHPPCSSILKIKKVLVGCLP